MSRFAWEPSARAGLRRIEQKQALSILHSLDRFGKTGAGDIRKLPAPIRKIIGDLSNTERVLVGLDIREQK